MTRFECFDLQTGLLADWSQDPFPTQLEGFSGGHLHLHPSGTRFGFVQSGTVELSCAAGDFRLGPGMYVSLPGEADLRGSAKMILICRNQFVGTFLIGGPIEARGRLRYIDGCTDSLLIPPLLYGDPCLNLLHFPPHIDQTLHTHPSMRVGIVVRGSGTCRLGLHTVPLQPGMAFYIPTDLLHAFRTDHQEMLIIAYHPDSDFGPRHDDHPMINRTLVAGTSARYLEALQTKDVALQASEDPV